jgi:glucosamine--fructose-6-phosphate aminotransferase (isomerizing)
MDTTFTWHEIMSQPDAWRSTLDDMADLTPQISNFFKDKAYERVIFTGCGSTYYLAEAACRLLREVSNVDCEALPGSEVWLYPHQAYRSDTPTLLIALSRSGETSETLNACNAFRAYPDHEVITLSCYPDTPLSHIGHLNLLIPAGQEESYAQTRAFTSLYLAVSVLLAHWRGEHALLEELQQLPDLCQSLLSDYGEVAQSIGRDLNIDRFYFLGSGLRHGLACELSMKMKEMALTQCEPFHVMEFRHGPQSMITPHTQVIALVSPRTEQQRYELAVLDDLRSAGARVLSIGGEGCDVRIGDKLSEIASSVLYVPIGQLIACERAVSKGLNPDRPFNLAPVVKLDTSSL